MDIYTKVFHSLNKSHIDYVCIGAFAINFFAQRSGHIITTQDCDIWIRPHWEHWYRGLLLLKKLGFQFEAGVRDEPEPLNLSDVSLMRRVFEQRSVVRAFRKEAEEIDIVLEIARFTFDQVYRTHKVFLVERVPVKVGKLKHLIQAKELANRPKDRLFLEIYKEILKEMLSSSRSYRRRN